MTQSETPATAPRHPAVTGLIALLWLETALIAAGAVLVFIGGVEAGFTPTTIALLVTAAILVAFVVSLAVGLRRQRRRLLGGVLTWQVLQLGCSIVGFQGLLGPEWLGWVLFVPALAGIILCISRPVVAVYGSAPKEH